jgi:leader peptidase (prepilin peptidase)/N-methyltransferase
LVVELLALASAVWLYQRDPRLAVFLPGLLVGLVFLLIAVIDIEHRLVLRVVVVPSAVVLAAIGALQPHRGPVKVLLGGVAGFLILWLMYLLGLAFSRWIARRRGTPLEEVAFGFGDVMLGGLIGLVVGWPGVIIAVVTGVLLAGVFSLGYVAVMSLRRRYSSFTPIPYGPFLLAGACLVYYGGRTALERLIG